MFVLFVFVIIIIIIIIIISSSSSSSFIVFHTCYCSGGRWGRWDSLCSCAYCRRAAIRYVFASDNFHGVTMVPQSKHKYIVRNLNNYTELVK